MESREPKKLLEAALFTAPGSMTVAELARACGSNVAETRVVLNELSHEYAERDSALEIRESEGGFRMGVRSRFEDAVMHLASSPQFHKGVLKTLAYIAYKQPVKQSEVIKFRNTKAYDHIALLHEKSFITKNRSGITFTLRTTKKFHQYFGTKEKLAKAVEEAPEEPDASGTY